jgi:nicotinamide-nucleotide amidase
MGTNAMPDKNSWRTFTVMQTPGATLTSLPNLAAFLMARASEQSLQIATAESCTAGALCNALAAAHGAAGTLYGGFVTYDEAAKTALLDVSADLLAEATAVSSEVARAMAMGVLGQSQAGLALAVTGVTGDSPDDRGNPRGRVHIAAAVRGGAKLHCHCEFGDLPSPVLLDATLRTATDLGIQALNWNDDGR